MIKLLKKLIFAKEEPKHESKWTIEHNGWRANAKQYDEFIARMRGVK
ncbi:Uncharacterised protein [Streptococcus urinalis]|uniref:Uncharacterized protein n=1 Tax=Streptococcus urinalis 2285-97 TaxID=764291 RepID=G5KER4_9STRE|nr:hypothetical protein STRUR_2123 [Streptococcus urinalis 2285-97]VEF32965.1 Uncharacterised protein [Streptococcus urinalis]